MSNFVKVLAADQLKPGQVTIVTVNGRDVCLANYQGEFFALDNKCPHRGGQLGDGRLEEANVICPLHGWDFDVRTGISRYDPRDRVATYPVRQANGSIDIDLNAVPPLPVTEGYLQRWARPEDDLEHNLKTIQHLARGIWHENTPMRTERTVPNFDDIYFLPGQLAVPPLLDDEPVDTIVVIGPQAKRPITLTAPIYISHMSFGALSREAKIALATGAAKFGTMNCSGEGGMLPEEQAAAKFYVFEMASGYFGWTEENIKKADAVEIKMGQSAKTGLGGVLPGSKVTGEIAQVRGLKPGQDAISPSRFPDIETAQQMRERIEWIRGVKPGIPVGIKFAAAKLEADLAAACELEVDFITIDGRPGGTGAAPKHVKDHIGIPTVYALPRARRWLDDHGMGHITLCITGGFRTPPDVAKALALGADAVALATGAMIAIGCQQYRACSSNNCPVGIATQRADLRDRFDIQESSQRLFNFLEGARQQLIQFARMCGRRRLADLSLADMVTYSDDLAKYTPIRHAAEPFDEDAKIT
jgi:glutamate synthase domain-containing protein 2/nitrite reductase/ring-hydroxylating ferredoxin subunit